MVDASREKSQELEERLRTVGERLASARQKVTPERINDFKIIRTKGEGHLSQLFGEHTSLLLIHSMGKACAYCTLWADGLNGLLPHLTRVSAVALISPDPIEIFQKFAEERNWGFQIASYTPNSFAAEMGFKNEKGQYKPGITGFNRSDEGINRLGSTTFGPGDEFCALWHLLPLIGRSPESWSPSPSS